MVKIINKIILLTFVMLCGVTFFACRETPTYILNKLDEIRIDLTINNASQILYNDVIESETKLKENYISKLLLLTPEMQKEILNSITIEVSKLDNGRFTIKKQFDNYNYFCFYYGLDYVENCINVKTLENSFLTSRYYSNFDFFNTFYEYDNTANILKLNSQNLNSNCVLLIKTIYSRFNSSADVKYLDESGKFNHIFISDNFENKSNDIYVNVANRFRWFMLILISMLIVSIILLLVIFILKCIKYHNYRKSKQSQHKLN